MNMATKQNVAYSTTDEAIREDTRQLILPRQLDELVRQADAKIREDLFRFRTCCADPRASK